MKVCWHRMTSSKVWAGGGGGGGVPRMLGLGSFDLLCLDLPGAPQNMMQAGSSA